MLSTISKAAAEKNTPKIEQKERMTDMSKGKTRLIMASTTSTQKKAYVLSDRGTFLNYESRIRLKIMVESDPLLKNQYSVMAVSLAKFPSVKYREAMDFIAFVTSSQGQKIIASYVKHGVNLFYPDAIPMSDGKKKGR